MKTTKNKIELELHWHGDRSIVLGGFQAEVNGNVVCIYGPGGNVVYQDFVSYSKSYARKKAAELIRKYIQREL